MADQQRFGPSDPTQAAQAWPPKTSRWRRGPGLWVLIAGGIALIVVVCLVIVHVVSNNTKQSGEVFLEPAALSGDNPFSPNSFAPPQQPFPPDPGPPAVPPTQPSAAPSATQSVDGAEPGVFGGTMNQTTCDADGLIKYLGQNPDRGRAWAGVFKIPADQIPAFIRNLTPVLLRADARVTDHRYDNGRVVAKQAVLEQGTAVLVNKSGEPSVRCYSGNPLTPPEALPVAPTYVGPANYVPRPGVSAPPVPLARGQAWPGFTPTRIIVIIAAVRLIDAFRLWDPFTRVWFWRFIGIVIVDIPFVAGVVPVRPPGAAPPPLPLPLPSQQGQVAAPLLRGTYNAHSVSAGYAKDQTVKVASDCPGCDATVAGPTDTIVLQWNGTVWQSTNDYVGCGSVTHTWTPTSMVNGIVQELSTHWSACGDEILTTMTRSGD